MLDTWRPVSGRRPDCHPIQRWAGCTQKIFDPCRGRQRLHSIFGISPALSHHMLHRLVGICLVLVLLSKGVLGLAKRMSPFTLDKERPWHGESVVWGWKSCRINLQESQTSALFMSLLEPHTLKCCTPVGSVKMPKLEVFLHKKSLPPAQKSQGFLWG